MQLRAHSWIIRRAEPGSVSDPSALGDLSAFHQTEFAGALASSLSEREGGYDPAEFDIDDFDWWYETEFSANDAASLSSLTFDGLATFAEVWLNGTHILTSRNMFVSSSVDVSHLISASNTLVILFRSLPSVSLPRKPRPGWKTRLVDNQRLRWVRTTLLGRIPAWTPKIRAVGPWRDIRLQQGDVIPDRVSVRPALDGTTGRVHVDCVAQIAAQGTLSATLEIGKQTFSLSAEVDDGYLRIHGHAELTDVMPWLPHTHGYPHLYEYRVQLEYGGEALTVSSGRCGFRSIGSVQDIDSFALVLNDLPIFWRGACWTSADMAALSSDRETLRRILTTAAEAGTNLIRVGGTMVYESDDFYDLCDELGIAVWQDFMFANMDYPIDDADFRSDVQFEIAQQVERLSTHACVIVFCGNSEVEQQAAMFGRSRDDYESELFYKLIPGELAAKGCDQIYVPSSPTGGALPFWNSVGVSHYFGIGAYKRPLSDAVTTKVPFTTECLGFSNIPGDAALQKEFGTPTPSTQSPEWKSGVPRDAGVHWDFEDVRDFYMGELFREDPDTIRARDNAHYFARSVVTSGEVMRRTFGAWRSPDNVCSGALIWQLMDLVPGAGWGFLDSDGARKPLFYYLKRAWAPLGMSVIDNGLDGLAVSLTNDSPDKRQCELEIQIIRDNNLVLERLSVNLALPPRSGTLHHVDEILGRFTDSTYAYRFGPLPHNVVTVSLHENGRLILTDAYFPDGYAISPVNDIDIEASVVNDEDNVVCTMSANAFLQDVKLSATGFEFTDNYFHLAPGNEKVVVARAVNGNERGFRCTLSALNLAMTKTLK